MDIRPITPDYAVSPQITPQDIAAIKAAGFVTIVNNRPDAEIPADLGSAPMRAAAEAAGLTFIDNPVTHQTLTDARVATQKSALDASSGPVLAYCASGTRSTIVWALGQVGNLPADEVVARAASAGYDIAGLAPRLSAPTGG